MADEYWFQLSQLFWHPDKIQAITERIGVEKSAIRWTTVAQDTWRDVLDWLCRERNGLDDLHEVVCSEVPAARERLDAARRTACGNQRPATGSPWYTAPDGYVARFVGEAAQRPVINRDRLRSGLQDFIAGFPVLLVYGEPGSGRSHSWHLIEHVARTTRAFVPHLVKIQREWASRDCWPVDLMRHIGGLLGIDEPFDVVATSDSAPRLMIDKLHHKVKQRDRSDCVVIDGVDYPTVRTETRALVRDLVMRVANNEVGRLKVVVTGRRTPDEVWDTNTSSGILLEDIEPIDGAEIQRFFMLTAEHLGHPIDETGAKLLMGRIEVELGPDRTLEILGHKVTELAREFARSRS